MRWNNKGKSIKKYNKEIPVLVKYLETLIDRSCVLVEKQRQGSKEEFWILSRTSNDHRIMLPLLSGVCYDDKKHPYVLRVREYKLQYQVYLSVNIPFVPSALFGLGSKVNNYLIQLKIALRAASTEDTEFKYIGWSQLEGMKIIVTRMIKDEK